MLLLGYFLVFSSTVFNYVMRIDVIESTYVRFQRSKIENCVWFTFLLCTRCRRWRLRSISRKFSVINYFSGTIFLAGWRSGWWAWHKLLAVSPRVELWLYLVRWVPHWLGKFGKSEIYLLLQYFAGEVGLWNVEQFPVTTLEVLDDCKWKMMELVAQADPAWCLRTSVDSEDYKDVWCYYD